jgi:hypothetical protein
VGSIGLRQRGKQNKKAKELTLEETQRKREEAWI